uniref:Uncharacterized protein n=1 Tax=Onchocerca volvulus TaxID=6282 RepID=A0A8R1TWF4_ONCVO
MFCKPVKPIINERPASILRITGADPGPGFANYRLNRLKLSNPVSKMVSTTARAAIQQEQQNSGMERERQLGKKVRQHSEHSSDWVADILSSEKYGQETSTNQNKISIRRTAFEVSSLCSGSVFGE